MDNERLTRCKQYLHVQYDDDDALLWGLILSADAYLAGAGIIRLEQSPHAYHMYDAIVWDMVSRIYDNREGAGGKMEINPICRKMMTQLKMINNYNNPDQ